LTTNRLARARRSFIRHRAPRRSKSLEIIDNPVRYSPGKAPLVHQHSFGMMV
jgi:hypothetical protein